MSYFNFKRKQLAIEQLRVCLESARKVGIEKALFINFGLLLGIIRENDFISFDDDVDVCLKADMITADQEIKYFKLLEKAGLFGARKKWSTVKAEDGFQKSLINSNKKEGPKVRLTWFSLRTQKEYPKFCHWLMFPWNGCYWHTKAGLWVTNRKFSLKRFSYTQKDDAILKGIPETFLKELITVNFYGLNVQIPQNYGSCLDFMYPGWLVPRMKGASAKKIVCVARDWHNRKTWRMVL